MVHVDAHAGNSGTGSVSRTAESDRQLLSRAKAGDDAAMDALLRTNDWIAVKLTRRMCGRFDEDIAQRARIAMWRAIQNFRVDGAANLQVFLWCCVMRAIINARRRTISQKHTLFVDPAYITPTCPYRHVHEVETKDEYDFVVALVGLQNLTYLIRRSSGETLMEIARSVGVGHTTMHYRELSEILRARKAISARLNRCGRFDRIPDLLKQ